MRYLVTGAGGFIGKFLTQQIALGGDEVVALGRSASPFKEHPRLTYVQADVSDGEAMAKLFSDFKFDVVVHLAAMIADECEADPSSALRVNVDATQNLMELSVKQGVGKFVFMSSQSVYDPDTPEPVREEQAGHPVLLYGITKYYGEMVGLWYQRKRGLDFRALRPSVVFGPTRYKGPSAEFSSKVIEKAIRGGKLIVKNPNDRVNYLYVRDVVDAVIRLAKADNAPARVYNAGGFATTVLDFVKAVKERYPSLDYEVQPEPTVRYPVVIDNGRIERELGWKPKYDLSKSVEDYAATLQRGEPLFSV